MDDPRKPARRSARLTRSRPRDQHGASLVLVLAVLAIMMLVTIALAGYATTLASSQRAYSEVRNQNYAGDAAMDAAINWAREQPNVGVDPSITPDPCVYQLPASEGRPAITVTCAAEDGAKSGIPNETGKVPSDAIRLLGERYGEVPQWSPCVGDVSDRETVKGREVGLLLDPIKVTQNGTSCESGSGAIGDLGFLVNGDINSNGPVRTNAGTLFLKDPGATADKQQIRTGTSPLLGSQSCIGSFGTTTLTGGSISLGSYCQPVSTIRSRNNPLAGNPNPLYNPFDPGERTTSSGEGPFRNPAMDGEPNNTEWRQADIPWDTTQWAQPYVAVNTNNAVPFNESTPFGSLCNGTSGNVVRFFPGWYRSAQALNRAFNTPECAAGVFWFSPALPNAGTIPSTSAVTPLPGASSQGVYVFEFRDDLTASPPAGWACKFLTNTDYRHRWCLKAATTDGGPLVVGGWPKGWDPAVVVGSSGSAPASRTLRYPEVIDTDGSRSWNYLGSLGNWFTTGIDGAYARYQPDSVLGIPLISSNRSLILRSFRQTTASNPPLVLTAVDPNQRVVLRLRHWENPQGGCISIFGWNIYCASIDNPTITLSTSENGVGISCTTIGLIKSNPETTARSEYISSDNTGPITVPPLSLAQRNGLRECFKTAERANNAQIKWEVTGDSINLGTPRVFLDGIEIDLQIPTGGFFPPVTDTSFSPPADGLVYCDKQKAGVQFIFGGDSSVHAGNAALQLCAGPAPSSPNNYQQIAVWGQPTNFFTKNGQAVMSRVGKVGGTSLYGTSVSFGQRCGYLCNWEQSTNFRPQYAARAGDRYTQGTQPVQAKWNPGIGDWLKICWTGGWIPFPYPCPEPNTRGWIDVSGFGAPGVGPIGTPGSCNSLLQICVDTATHRVDKVFLKVGYNTYCGLLGGLFNCPGAAGATYKIGNSSGWWCDPGDGANTFPPNRRLSSYIVDVSGCFNTAASPGTARLNDPTMKVRFQMDCNFCFNLSAKYVEGLELIVQLRPLTYDTQALTPLQGCHRSPTGYGSGFGSPSADVTAASGAVGRDCALISGGRVAIQGTVFAPDAAIEIADGDVMYPFATRGVVARHLRVRAYKYRSGYAAPAISNVIDDTKRDRVVIFRACRRTTGTTQPCGTVAGDVVVTEAKVRFTNDLTRPLTDPKRQRIAQVVYWDSNPNATQHP